MKIQSSCVLLILLLGISIQGSAEVYKWVDANGETHYGEKPGDVNATEVQIQGAPRDDVDLRKQNEERDKLLKVYEEERNVRNEEKRKAEEEKSKNREKCLMVENDLKDMRQGGLRYYDLDEKGERKYISDTELEQRIRQMQEYHDQHCQ